MLVRLVCPRPLLFCSIALDESKRKKIVHMVRIQLAWLVECGRFRECLGNNPGGPKWKHRIGRMAYRADSSGGFPVKKLHFGVGRQTRHCTRQRLEISAGVIVAIVRGISLDARNMSVLSAGKRWSDCIRQWSMNGKNTFTLKYCIAVSSISPAVDQWAILCVVLGFSITTSTESTNASIFPQKLRKVLSSLCSLMTFLHVFASIHAFTISRSVFCKT